MRQRLRVRLRLGLGLSLRRCGALELRIGRLGAMLPLPLSLATKAPRRCSLLELRTEGVHALLLTLSRAAGALRRCGALEVRIEGVKLSYGVLRQRRAGSAPPLPRGAADDRSEMLEMTVLHREVTSSMKPRLRG